MPTCIDRRDSTTRHHLENWKKDEIVHIVSNPLAWGKNKTIVYLFLSTRMVPVNRLIIIYYQSISKCQLLEKLYIFSKKTTIKVIAYGPKPLLYPFNANIASFNETTRAKVSYEYRQPTPDGVLTCQKSNKWTTAPKSTLIITGSKFECHVRIFTGD